MFMEGEELGCDIDPGSSTVRVEKMERRIKNSHMIQSTIEIPQLSDPRPRVEAMVFTK